MNRKLIEDTARNLGIAKKGFIEAIALKKIEPEHVATTKIVIENLELNIRALKYTEWNDKLKVMTINNLERLAEQFESALPTIEEDKRNASGLIVKKLQKNIRKLMELDDE